MQVTCPSCKFVGTVRDELVPPEGRELHCPNCYSRFRARKNATPSMTLHDDAGRGTTAPSEPPEALPVTCPACGSRGNIRRVAVTSGKKRLVTCPSCRESFTYTPPSDGEAPPAGALHLDSLEGGQTICPMCGSDTPRTVPVCIACGEKLRGITVHCPSCRSTNVGISDVREGNGRPPWVTTVYKPVILPIEKLGGIRIPAWCRDCGRTWEIEPALVPKTGKTAGSSE